MSKMRKSSCSVFMLLFFLLSVGQAQESIPQDRITFSYKSRTQRTTITRDGRVLLTAKDGGMLFEDRSGIHWLVKPADLKEKKELAGKFAYRTKDEIASRLRKELGQGFHTIQTRHYVICSSAASPYTQWCGELFEHLEETFLDYWKNKGLELTPPKKPLVAIVFKTKQEFANYALKDGGPGVAASHGYYSLRTNRMAMYDITASGIKQPARTVADVRKRVESSLFNVATIIHEATHQIAFNTGMHTRYADNPVWVTEGMAMFFETPTKKRKNQWKYIGVVNKTRLKQFRTYANSRRPNDALQLLISSDQRFSDPQYSTDAYAESWALTYHLIKRKPKAYVSYLKELGSKKQLVFDKPERRLELFQKHFGEDLKLLDRRFISNTKRLRGR